MVVDAADLTRAPTDDQQLEIVVCLHQVAHVVLPAEEGVLGPVGAHAARVGAQQGSDRAARSYMQVRPRKFCQVMLRATYRYAHCTVHTTASSRQQARL